MNKKIGIIGAIINLCGVLSFALSMIIGSNFTSYLASCFIALGFVIMICVFCTYTKEGMKSSGYVSAVFAAMYSTIIFLVYFAQLTTVRLNSLNSQALQILKYQNFGLFFNYDLLGYCFMSISTFFVGLTIDTARKSDKWLKALLMIHGVFSIACFIMPVLGVFNAQVKNTNWIGTAILEFWCLYFTPISILSIIYFNKKDDQFEKSN